MVLRESGMPAKRHEVHWYAVYVAAYADEATAAGIERKDEYFMMHGRILAEVFYNGSSRLLAERAFTRAALAAMQNPLVFEIYMQRDGETIIKAKAQRD
jgi:hypothetical protein